MIPIFFSTEYTILIAKVCLIFTIADITLKKQLHLRTQFHAVRQTHIVDTEKLNLFCFDQCYQNYQLNSIQACSSDMKNEAQRNIQKKDLENSISSKSSSSSTACGRRRLFK